MLLEEAFYPTNYTGETRNQLAKDTVKRNEGTLEENLRDAIAFLVRKGFGDSGKKICGEPLRTFDGWEVALQKYKGENKVLKEGKYAGDKVQDAYAKSILNRINNPTVHEPVKYQS